MDGCIERLDLCPLPDIPPGLPLPLYPFPSTEDILGEMGVYAGEEMDISPILSPCPEPILSSLEGFIRGVYERMTVDRGMMGDRVCRVVMDSIFPSDDRGIEGMNDTVYRVVEEKRVEILAKRFHSQLRKVIVRRLKNRLNIDSRKGVLRMIEGENRDMKPKEYVDDLIKDYILHEIPDSALVTQKNSQPSTQPFTPDPLDFLECKNKSPGEWTGTGGESACPGSGEGVTPPRSIPSPPVSPPDSILHKRPPQRIIIEDTGGDDPYDRLLGQHINRGMRRKDFKALFSHPSLAREFVSRENIEETVEEMNASVWNRLERIWLSPEPGGMYWWDKHPLIPPPSPRPPPSLLDNLNAAFIFLDKVRSHLYGSGVSGEVRAGLEGLMEDTERALGERHRELERKSGHSLHFDCLLRKKCVGQRRPSLFIFTPQ